MFISAGTVAAVQALPAPTAGVHRDHTRSAGFPENKVKKGHGSVEKVASDVKVTDAPSGVACEKDETMSVLQKKEGSMEVHEELSSQKSVRVITLSLICSLVYLIPSGHCHLPSLSSITSSACWCRFHSSSYKCNKNPSVMHMLIQCTPC